MMNIYLPDKTITAAFQIMYCSTVSAGVVRWISSIRVVDVGSTRSELVRVCRLVKVCVVVMG